MTSAQMKSFTYQESTLTFLVQLKLMRKTLRISFLEARELILSQFHLLGKQRRFKRLEKFLALKELTSKFSLRLRTTKVLKTLIPSFKFLMELSS